MKLSFCLFLLVLIPGLMHAQDYAIKQLEESPRHHEWVELTSNDRTLYSFVAYPEREDESPVVIVIHENRGLNDWARSFTDQLAAEGFIAIAPDLLSQSATGVEKTTDFETSDDARKAIYALDADRVTNDLVAITEYAKTLEAGNGKVVVIGFCWGGSQSFRFATNAGDRIEAAIVCYGTAPKETTSFESIEVPVFGLYGGADNRVNATIPATEKAMNSYDKTYEYEIYDGAGHAFFRRGDNPDEQGPNKLARDKGWEKILEILKNQ